MNSQYIPINDIRRLDLIVFLGKLVSGAVTDADTVVIIRITRMRIIASLRTMRINRYLCIWKIQVSFVFLFLLE